MKPEPSQLVRRILRVNHAGEHGAVAIHSAQIAQLSRSNPTLGDWLAETLSHEQSHRAAFREAMPARAAKPCRAMCTAAVERTVHGHLVEQALLLDRIDPELAALVRSIQIEEDEHLADAEARHDRATLFAKVVSSVVTFATAALIALSTRGDSLRLTRLA